MDVAQLGGDAGDDTTELGGAGDGHGLGVQGVHDLGGQGLGQPRGSGPHERGDALGAQCAQRGGGGCGGECVEDSASDVLAQQAFQCRMHVQERRHGVGWSAGWTARRGRRRSRPGPSGRRGVSSSVPTRRRVCGMVRAASAMM